MPAKQLPIDLTGQGGLAPKFFGDISRSTPQQNLRYNANDNQFVDGYFNPMVRDGYLHPANFSYKNITAGGTITTYGQVPRVFLDDLAVSSVVYAGTDARVRLSANLGSYGADGFSRFDSDATSVGTVCDLEIYQVNTVRKLFIAAEDKVSIYDTTSGVYDTTWSTVTVSGAASPTSSPYSRLINSDNGFLYWLIGNLVYKLDGTAGGGANGTMSLALTFPKNQYLYDGLSTRGKLIIAVNPNADTNLRNNTVITTRVAQECGLYVWDRSSAITALSDFYPIPGVHQIRKVYVAPNGDIRVMCVGTNRNTIMFRFTGSSFEKMYDLPPTSYPNQPKGLGNSNDATYWLGADGILYANVFPTGGKEYIVKLLDTASVATEIAGTARTIQRSGAILVGGRYDSGSVTTGYRADYESILLSFRDSNSTDYVIRYLPNISGHLFDSVTPLANQGNVYTKVFFLPPLSNVVAVNVSCIPVANTGATTIATLKFYANQSSTPFKTKNISLSEASKGYISIPLRKNYANAFQMEIEWATNLTLGQDTFCPSFALLEYDTSKRTPSR